MENKNLIETIIDEERKIEYVFVSTFGFLKQLESKGLQSGLFYEILGKGEAKIEEIAKALQCSLIEVNNKHVDYKSSEKHVQQIIERFGVMEASALIYHILTKAMIGDIKKQKATHQENVKKVMDQLFPPLSWKSFINPGLLWVAISIVSGLVVGMSITRF